MDEKKQKITPLEEHLISAMRAIDNQVAREMQRTPSERDTHGVQKWEPYAKRVELIASLALNHVGSNDSELDSVLVLSQAYVKALVLLVNDLGQDGLGKVRTDYCTKVLSTIMSDSDKALRELRNETDLM